MNRLTEIERERIERASSIGVTALAAPEASEIPGSRRLGWSLASALSVAVTAFGVLVLLAWALRSDALESFGPGFLSMKANVAFCFVVLGLAIWARRRPGPMRILGQRVAGAIVMTVGALTCLEYLLGVDLGLDQLVFADPIVLLEASDPPGRMAPTTAICLVLLGGAFLGQGALSSRRLRGSSVLVTLSALLAFAAFVGNLYDANALYGAFTQMSVEASIGLIALCIAAVAIAPHESIGAVLLRASAGGVVARRLAPSAVLVPVAIGGIVLSGERIGLYDSAFGVLLMVVANVIAFSVIASWVSWTLDHEHSRRMTAERSADTDVLTSLRSRRAIVDQLEVFVARSQLNADPFSVLVIDGDGLKHLNDGYGHAAGDAALLRLGQLIVATLRDSDITGRIGGDEFLALLPRTSGREAQNVAERLRRALLPQDPAHLTLTASVGVGEWSTGMTAGELLLAADGALYEDKRSRDLAS